MDQPRQRPGRVYRGEITDRAEQWGKPVVVDECGYEGDLEYGWGNLSGEELLHQFWDGAVRGGYAGHGETYWDADEEIWWSKGGRLVGTSPARIGFLEEVVAASPTGVLDPLPSDFDLPWAGVQDEYLVSYHGRGRPRERHVLLPPGRWRVDVLDTWECTVDRLPGVHTDVRVGAAARQALPGCPAGGGLMRTSITPGQVWLDTDGNRIHAHGGSILEVDGTFYWYGENKERSTPGSGIWHWGVRCYSSTDLYNWTDRGLIIPPDVDDPTSPLHPAMSMDRPHILRHPDSGAFVCWLKVMSADRSALHGARRRRHPRAVPGGGADLKPLGMNAGDFDLVVDPTDGKGYYYFERVHSELICADLTEDYTNVTGYYSTHFPLVQPPYVREAPAYFTRNGRALPGHLGNDRLLPQSLRGRESPRATTARGRCSTTRIRTTRPAPPTSRRSARCSGTRTSRTCTSPSRTGGCPATPPPARRRSPCTPSGSAPRAVITRARGPN